MGHVVDNYDEDDDIYDKRKNAIKNLVDAGVIIKYEIVERYESGHIPVYYAVCKINKNKLFEVVETVIFAFLNCLSRKSRFKTSRVANRSGRYRSY